MGRILYGQRKLSLGEKVAMVIKAQQLPEPEREHRFHPMRKWRFDFCWVDEKIALEIEGGIFVKGRHSRGTGYANDADKYNEATKLGWRVFRLTTRQLSSWSKIRKEVEKLKQAIESLT